MNVKYELCKNVMIDDSRRKAFNTLANHTFQLSFENWYQEGYWTNTNIPYTLFDGNKAISSISVNRMELLWEGCKRSYIQLGTVMTDISYRNQGLSRYLMNEIVKEWEERCDSMFLFANDSVLDFYPKLGFKMVKQYQYSMSVINPVESARKLDMNCLSDRELLKKYYAKTNPFSKLQIINNYSLLMFYCGSFMKDFVCYTPQYDAVVIAQQEGNVLYCYDIYCDAGKELQNIIASIAKAETVTAVFKFTPEDSGGCQSNPVDDDALFLLKGKENLFESEKLMFPEISHT